MLSGKLLIFCNVWIHWDIVWQGTVQTVYDQVAQYLGEEVGAKSALSSGICTFWATGVTMCIVGVGSFCINSRFHPTSSRQNLGWTQVRVI